MVYCSQMKRSRNAAAVFAATPGSGCSKGFGAKEWHKDLLVSWIFDTSIRLQVSFDSRLMPYHMTLQEAGLLLRCVEAPGTTHGRLAIAIGRDISKVTRFIRRLEVRRLIIREIDRRDRRVSVIRPTAKGKTVAAGLASIFDNIRKRLFASISESDVHRVSQVLRQLNKNAVHVGARRRQGSSESIEAARWKKNPGVIQPRTVDRR
jgi:DNA-binding MarR family transcriptional regulator